MIIMSFICIHVIKFLFDFLSFIYFELPLVVVDRKGYERTVSQPV